MSGSTCLDSRELYYTLLGVVPENTYISEQILRLSWLSEHFSSLESDTDVEIVYHYAREFML